MKKTLFLLIIVLTSNVMEAQFIKEKSIHAKIGYGLSAPYNSVDKIVATGFFAQGELVLKATSWVEFRPYAGFILTNSNGKDLNNNPTNEKVESKAFLLGGKARVRARSEEHTSELQSRPHLVCRLLLEKKKKKIKNKNDSKKKQFYTNRKLSYHKEQFQYSPLIIMHFTHKHTHINLFERNLRT